ncbi:hypothetical protein [Bosea sp. TND4EK4]|uniref:hypothetical protein n=1 Tax=Bosea sp. TND4EK4 TaxID=1907408 RepID=UPI000955CA86|nr:hypothetical protein [Bosea sp. TND4EK4]SIR35882.1 hypothetical protein SAMN05880592_11738 [Bosea sp. TND4EK4]
MRLVFDQAFGLDEDSLHDVVAVLSERLRAHPRLRRPLDRVVGNRWAEFEHDLTHFIAALSARTGDHGGGLAALFDAFPELAPEHVADARDLFVESALAILPLHAAASLSDLADSVCDLTLRALRLQSSETSAIPLPRRISEAEEALRIGAGLG